MQDSIQVLVNQARSVRELPNIFISYYQCHIQNYSQGIGAGLSLVKKILDEITAKIVVESTFKKGTTVTITFKRETITMDNAAKLARNIKLSDPVIRMNLPLKKEVYNEKRKTILVVEHNVEFMAYLQINMNEFNFNYAKNGKDALLKIEIMQRPDIIISDIMMDVMDGFEFLALLREKK